MHISAIVVSLVLALAMLASGAFKLSRAPHIMKFAESVHLTPPQLTMLGGLQIAATVGLVWGVWFRPFAIAAAVGLVLYFAGAVGAHVRAGDRSMQGAVGFLLLSGVTLTLLGATA